MAKTTIYRRYANTDDLLRHLSVAVGEPLDFSGFDTTFDGLRGVLKCIVDCFDEGLDSRRSASCCRRATTTSRTSPSAWSRPPSSASPISSAAGSLPAHSAEM